MNEMDVSELRGLIITTNRNVAVLILSNMYLSLKKMLSNSRAGEIMSV